MVSRSEIDMKHIKTEYKKNYSKTLHQEILVSKHSSSGNENEPIKATQLLFKNRVNCFNIHTVFFSFLQDDTKGDYEKILLALCGGEN